MFLRFASAGAWRHGLSSCVVPADGGGAALPAKQAPAPVSGTEDAAPAGVFVELGNALTSARATLAGFLDLVSIEAQRAGHALLWILVGAVVAAIVIVTAWFGLMAAVVLWAVSLGYSAAASVLALAALNLAVGAALILRCIGMTGDLLFPASRRQLAGQSQANPAVP